MQSLCYMAMAAVASVHTLGPWLSILVLSGSLAFALNQTLIHGAPEPWADQEPRVVSAPELWSSRTLVSPTEPSMRWVIFSSTDGQGARTSVACLTEPNGFAADTIELDPADMRRLAADLHCQTHSS